VEGDAGTGEGSGEARREDVITYRVNSLIAVWRGICDGERTLTCYGVAQGMPTCMPSRLRSDMTANLLVAPEALRAAAAYKAVTSSFHCVSFILMNRRSYVINPFTSPSTSVVWVHTPPEHANKSICSLNWFSRSWVR
jgi:hypothetical protein